MYMMENNAQQVLKIYVEDNELKKQYIDHIEEHNLNITKDQYSDSGFDLLSPDTLQVNNKTLSTMVDFKVKTAMYVRNYTPPELNYVHAVAYSGGLMGLFILLNQAILGFYFSLLIGGILMLNENNHLLDVADDYYVENPLPFMLIPRSSTGKKTPLRLSNSVGLIDKGYRGNLKACVDNVHNVVEYEEVEPDNPEKTQEDYYTIDQYTRLFQLVSFTGESIKVELVNKLDDLSETTRGEGGFGSTDTDKSE